MIENSHGKLSEMAIKEEKKECAFITLRRHANTKEESDWLEYIFTMILCLNQQKNLRNKLSDKE